MDNQLVETKKTNDSVNMGTKKVLQNKVFKEDSRQVYKFANINKQAMDLFHHTGNKEPVIQRIVAKETNGQVNIYFSKHFLDYFNELCNKLAESKGKDRQFIKVTVRHNYFNVLKNAIITTGGGTSNVVINWEEKSSKDLNYEFSNAELGAHNTLLYKGKKIELPLLEDLVDIWEPNRDYTTTTGCTGDSLAVFNAAGEEKLGAGLSQNGVKNDYNNVTIGDEKVQPYYTGGSDIYYRKNNLKLVYRFDKSIDINKRYKLNHPKMRSFVGPGTKCIVSVCRIVDGKDDMGHNIAVINSTVYDMQHNENWRTNSHAVANVAPSECAYTFEEFEHYFGNYYVEYIYN